MRFRKLTIEGYKSFQFATEITFPEPRDGRSIFLVGGMNGAGKTSFMEAVNICLYGAKSDFIYKAVNRKEMAKGNVHVSFELVLETDDMAEIVVKRTWSAGTVQDPKPKDLEERLVVVRDGKRVTVQNKQMWQDFIRAMVPPGITQFFFFDGEKIQEIAADDHSEVRLKASLEAALGIEYINRLSADVLHIKAQERQGHVDVSDEDLDFKQSEFKKERAKLDRKQKERDEVQDELDDFKTRYEEAKKRFQATFHIEPDSREEIRQNERKKITASNRLTQIESDIKLLCERALPLALAGKLFGPLKRQIVAERETVQHEAIRENAAALAKQIVRVVEEPEPIYREHLSPEKMRELEHRIYQLLKQGASLGELQKILNLSERDAARVLHRVEEIEGSEVFLLRTFIEERRELEAEIRRLDSALQAGISTDTERELFEQLQADMESCSTQIGRKTEQLRLLEEEILALQKKVRDIEAEVGKLYEKHNVSKEKADFIGECDAVANLLSQFVVRLRKNKVHLLQEKTFEMYRQLSSKSGLIKDLMINDKTYEVSLQDRNGHEIRKSGLSAGEKEIFAVSLLWGLAQTSQLKLPIIIDTPLSRLDSTHRDNIVHNYFPNAGEQVVVLSTDTEVDSAYYATLRPYLAGAGILEFDQRRELTTFKPGYFWEN